MKNQYFGDINDYRKYGLIRTLTGYGTLRSIICWMLTEDDDRPDGGKVEYLNEQEMWRKYDRDLFTVLRDSVIVEGRRSIQVAREKNIIPGADYYETLLTDDRNDRSSYMAQFHQDSQGKDLIFYDPDNGLEVSSVRPGTKNSSKYLYWSELIDIHNEGASLLIYQHFPREKRDAFITRRVAEFQEKLKFDEIISFRTSNVVFFLLALERHMAEFNHAISQLSEQWGDQFEVRIHTKTDPVSTEENYLIKVQIAQSEYASIVWDLVLYYSNSGDFEKAHNWIERLMSLTDDPETHAHLYLSLGRLLEKQEDYQAAIDFYHQVLAINPKNDETKYFSLNNTGYCLNKLGEYHEAEVFCNEAIAISALVHNAHKNLGIAVAGQERYAEAAEAYMTSVQVQPRDPRSLKLLEDLYRDHPEIADEVPDFEDRLRICREIEILPPWNS